jgi:carbohydrate diacid regulator
LGRLLVQRLLAFGPFGLVQAKLKQRYSYWLLDGETMVMTQTTAPRVAPERGRCTISLMTPFERIAESITDRLIELLCTDIWVLDEEHIVIGSNRARDIGHRLHLSDSTVCQNGLRLPLSFGEHTGTVLIGPPFHGERISPRLAQALVRMVVGQTLALERIPQHAKQKHAFIYHLLQRISTDEAAVLREASMLGLDLATPRAVILIDAKDYILRAGQGQERDQDDTREQQRANLVIGSVMAFFHLPNDTICAYIGHGEITVLKACNTKNLLPWANPGTILDGANATWANLAALKRASEALLLHLHSDISESINIGIGRYHPGVGGMARSYQDARTALAVGQRCAAGYQVHCLNHLGIAAFVGSFDERTKLELATHLLSPLDHEPELLATLQVFFAQNCCPSATAGRLSVHRNTLAYRLQKVALLTGLDPRRFGDATQIHLALVLRSLEGSSIEGSSV